MSQRVMNGFNTREFGLRAALLQLILLVASSQFISAQNQSYLVAYTQVRQPAQLISKARVSLPTEFSKHPFSIYHVFNSESPDRLESVLCLPIDSAGAWKKLAEKNHWKAVNKEEMLFYFQDQSLVVESSAIQARIVDHLRYTPNSVASGGLMDDWVGALEYVQQSADLKEALIAFLFPFIENRAQAFRNYSHWLIDELATIENIIWEVDPSQASGDFALSVTTKKGSRLNRLFNAPSGSDFKLFDFVPGSVSELHIGRLNRPNTTNYFNHFF